MQSPVDLVRRSDSPRDFDILAGMVPVVRALEELDVRYYVTGSVASCVHGVIRDPLDVDLVADLTPAAAQALAERLAPCYALDHDEIAEALLHRDVFYLLHLDMLLKIDVFLPQEWPWSQGAFARARPVVLDQETACAVVLAAPEDVVLAKLERAALQGPWPERQVATQRQPGPSDRADACGHLFADRGAV